MEVCGQSAVLASLEHLLSRLLLDTRRASPFARLITLSDSRSTSKQGAASVEFVEVAPGAGLGLAQNLFGGTKGKHYLLEETGCGVAFFDSDNDGWLDIFLVNGTTWPASAPARNPRAGCFITTGTERLRM